MSIDIGDEAAMKALIDGASTETSANLFDEPENIATQTALHNVYSFWFHRRGHQVNKAASYEETIIKLGTFRTVSFVSMYRNFSVSLWDNADVRLSISGAFMIISSNRMKLKPRWITTCSKMESNQHGKIQRIALEESGWYE